MSLAKLYDWLREGTSKFPKDARESKYGEIMRNSGYVEDSKFKDSDTKQGYFCDSCEYMVAKFNSPTGYFCKSRLFPDRPYGCCDYYVKKE